MEIVPPSGGEADGFWDLHTVSWSTGNLVYWSYFFFFLNISFFFFNTILFFIFWPYHVACGILVP